MFRNTAEHLKVMTVKNNKMKQEKRQDVYRTERAYTLLDENHSKRMAEFSNMQLTKDKIDQV